MRDSTRRLNADINVTPFLDVLLVLMITFLAAVTARKTMDVHLPIPCADACAGGEVPIVLEVLSSGAYRLNRTPVAASALFPTLFAAYAGRPDKVIHVAGHRGARYQAVLVAMDVARSAGVKVISIPPGDSYTSP
jgi:biopolymer transport protein ExbD